MRGSITRKVNYLAFKRLHEMPRDAAVELRPVLFAGLLNHFGNKGPAEIDVKRRAQRFRERRERGRIGRLRVDEARLESPEVKDALRKNTEAAAARKP
jgi:2-hydroxychromene-2-carboxylate isomerase